MGQAGPWYEGPCNGSRLYTECPDGEPLALSGAQGPSDSVTSAKATGMSQEGEMDFRLAWLRPQIADRTQTALLTWPQEASTEAIESLSWTW